jgi:hypothetical protein
LGVLGARIVAQRRLRALDRKHPFDAREFTRAGLEYTWRANISILIQTLVVLIAVALLGPLSKRRHNRPA